MASSLLLKFLFILSVEENELMLDKTISVAAIFLQGLF